MAEKFTRLSKEEAKIKVLELAKRFGESIDDFKKLQYKEHRARVDYIDPLFSLLGWDIKNENKLPETKREVVSEDKLRIGRKAKAPDYGFQVGGVKKFYLEAKAPHVNLDKEKDPAYQVRIYGYNKKLPISILTDFEEFAVYDTKIAPKEGDTPHTARLFYCTYKEYEEQFDEIWSWCSYDAMSTTGSKYNNAVVAKARKGELSVDENFLEYLRKHRLIIAREIANRNKEAAYEERHFNYIVQKLLDRIIFLRIAEDRAFEPDKQLKKIIHGNSCYESILALFRKCETKYDSTLFDEKDDLFFRLHINDKPLKDFIQGLYYPSPYDFGIMPIEILGHIYEQFLGDVIRVLAGGGVKIEQKPEVRKAGGVYYTPEYIVDYIVQNTVGETITKMTPEEVSEISVLDPACGSGSFLIGAYEYLLDRHLDYYTKTKARRDAAIRNGALRQYTHKNADGEVSTVYLLTIEKKREILLNNIYGVDIDPQAVEVTKLSLHLKMLEDENAETQDTMFTEEGLTVLPDLSKNNIKCGNSLVGSDFYDGQDLALFDEVTRLKINAFDWEDEFPEVFAKGGFDCVIGNPPYLKEYTDTFPFLFKDTNLKKYYTGKMDLWYAFTCFSIDIMKKNGIHSFIATNNWHTSAGASILRKKILAETTIKQLVDFADFKVFSEASIQTMIYVLIKRESAKSYNVEYKKVIANNKFADEVSKEIFSTRPKPNFVKKYLSSINKNKIKDSIISFVDKKIEKIIIKNKEKSNFSLNDNEVIQGIVAAPDKCFIISNPKKFTENENRFIKPYYTGVERYYSTANSKYIIYLSASNFKENIKNYKNIYSHFSEHKKELIKAKIKYKTPNKPYYFLHRERDENFFKPGGKIIAAIKARYPKFYYTEEPFYGSRALHVIKSDRVNLKYLTGLLNSKVITFFLDKTGKKQGNQLQIDKSFLLNLPLLACSNSKTEYKISTLVDQMLEAQKNVHNAKTPYDKKQNEKYIASIDKQIDALIYELYELTDKEIAIVEAEVGKRDG